jgi:MFS transporter, DHA3 family, macrolide efflux protein
MAYERIFRQPHLLGLWLSQVFSAIGDQLYTIAILWIAVQTGGAAAGFVAGAGSIAGLCLGLFGGVYADRWNRRTTMIAADLLRAFSVLALAAIGSFRPLTLFDLGLASVVVSGLGTLFEPAMIASLPELTGGSERSLQAMNALMQVNQRFARTVGPAISGWLAAVTSIHYFFTLDALTFLVSAAAIFSIGRRFNWHAERREHVAAGLSGIWQDICRGGSLINRHEQLRFAFGMYIVANMAWSSAFMVGLPLWARQLPCADVGTYGVLVASYGVGSVATNIIMGMVRSRRRMFFISLSQIFFALGFMLVACAHSLPLACAGVMLSAIGGPTGDLMMMVMLQSDMPREDLGKIYSARQFISYLGSSLGLFMAPALFHFAGVQTGIAVSALAFALLGVVGFMKFGLSESSSPLCAGNDRADTREKIASAV